MELYKEYIMSRMSVLTFSCLVFIGIMRMSSSWQVDIYAYGLIMYFMSSGKAPFHQLGLNPEVAWV